MTDSDITVRAIDTIKRFADQIAENSFQMSVEFVTTAGFARTVLLPRMDGEHGESRDKLAWAIGSLASSIPDLAEITMAMDSYGVVIQANAITDEVGYPLKTDGTRFGPGDMQHAFENDTVDKHLVTEAIMVMTCTADGFTSAMVNYERTDEGVKISPNQPASAEGAMMGGDMAHMMRRGFEAPKLMDLIKQDKDAPPFTDFGLNEGEAILHMICAVVKQIMVRTQWPCMIGAASEEEQALVKKSLSEGPFSGMGQVVTQDDLEEIVNLEETWENS